MCSRGSDRRCPGQPASFWTTSFVMGAGSVPSMDRKHGDDRREPFRYPSDDQGASEEAAIKNRPKDGEEGGKSGHAFTSVANSVRKVAAAAAATSAFSAGTAWLYTATVI
jgi:hypothetical protein